MFDSADRTKHLALKQAHPELDVRFLFQRASTPIRKGSTTTYTDWCDKHGFLWADKVIPPEWLT